MSTTGALAATSAFTRPFWLAAALFATGLIAGCNTPTRAIENAAREESATTAANAGETAEDGTEATEGDVSETEKTATIIRKPATVSQKGTHIRAVVNGEAITNYDVQRRAAFLKLRRVGGDRQAKALEELVDQAIKLQEAKQRNLVAKDDEVDKSFARFAKSNKMSTAQMTNVLSRAGVTADHFKEFVRGQISWNRAVGAKFQAETRRKTTQEALFDIRKSGGDKPETTEYLLQQVIFVIPEAKREALRTQRRAEALAFKQQFTACEETAKRAVGLTDVAVRNLPRNLEPQLPPEWRDEISATPEGGTTDVKATDKGIEFLAVCSRRQVSDDDAVRVLDQAKQFDSFNERGDEIAEKLLKELKANAKIVYR